jgi:hypothetical protein
MKTSAIRLHFCRTAKGATHLVIDAGGVGELNKKKLNIFPSNIMYFVQPVFYFRASTDILRNWTRVVFSWFKEIDK